MFSTPHEDGDGGRASSACFYLLFCLFFLVTLAGGSFLLLYITLPESENTAWFPLAGMVLVATPWVFWIMTFIYRALSACCFRRESVVQKRSPSTVLVSPVAGKESDEADENGGGSPVEPSGGDGTKRVAFGALASTDQLEGNGNCNGHGMSCSDGGEISGNSDSSLTSNDSEKPLTFSMSLM